jgi:hypothetical protein
MSDDHADALGDAAEASLLAACVALLEDEYQEQRAREAAKYSPGRNEWHGEIASTRVAWRQFAYFLRFAALAAAGCPPTLARPRGPEERRVLSDFILERGGVV